ncbi:MAG: sterol desaturase/sphingolipid hydroxylase (fatty acid hydroxylase superfamily) [Acidimicrobiales bacterium]|jgi:sterol desaturase/sphingolipid hydroxylase (fatty acid hydroxylase superfamily)
MLRDATTWLLDNNLQLLVTAISCIFLVETAGLLPRGRSIDRSQTARSALAGFAYLIGKIVGTKASIFVLYIWLWENYRLFDIPVFTWWSWLVLWVIGDFAYYWIHRMEHSTRLFWASHSIHHSSTDFNYTTAVRMPWMEMFYKPVIVLWAPLLGFDPMMYAALGALALIFGQLQHSETVGSLGVLDKIFVTPVNHRVHHASNTEYLDTNFGASFIVWDRMFGTYQAFDETITIRYGILHDKTRGRLIDVLTGGFPQLLSDLRCRRITGRQLFTMNA